MPKIIHILKKLLFATVLAVTFLFSKESKGQCVVGSFDIPACIITNDIVTFTNTSFDNNCAPCAPYGNNNACNANQATTYEWLVLDSNGNFVSNFSGFSGQHFTLAFPAPGIYNVSLDVDIPGANWKCCFGTGNGVQGWDTNVVVVNYGLTLNANDSLTICGGGGIDTADLNLQISNAIGNLSFEWTTQPGLFTYNGVSANNIPNTETSIVLTITDDVSECTASDTIILSLQTSSFDPSFSYYYLNGSGCSSASMLFIANDSNATNINWFANNNLIATGNSFATTLSTYLGNNTSVNISLSIPDTIQGCSISSDTDFVFTGLPFIALDTSETNTNSPTHWDETHHGFSGCQSTNGSISLTFDNSNFTSGNQNIDSLVFSWPGMTNTSLTGTGLADFLSGNNSISNIFLIDSVISHLM